MSTYVKPLQPVLAILERDTSAPINSVIDEIRALAMRKRRVGQINTIYNADESVFAIRCQTTDRLVRVLDNNGEEVFATKSISKTGYTTNCNAAIEHARKVNKRFDKKLEELKARAVAENMSFADYNTAINGDQETGVVGLNEKREQALRKFTLPESYVSFDTAEEAQEAAQ